MFLTRAIIKKRLESFIQSWPASMGRDFREYAASMRAAGTSSGGETIKRKLDPFWIALPYELIREYGQRRRTEKPPRSFPSDVLWGQYCLFLFVRIQDDLFDEQAKRLSLLFVSDQFLFEAERVFSKHFPKTTPFWTVYSDCLQTSTRAIYRLDRVQRSPTVNPRNLLSLYAKVSTVFKVGLAAVCAKFDRMEDFRNLKHCADELAIAGQILDDLRDIEEDLRRGRINYVVRVLLDQAGNRAKTKRIRRELALDNFLIRNGGSEILREVRRHVGKAQAILDRIHRRVSMQYFSLYWIALDGMESALHRQRVRLVFDGILQSDKGKVTLTQPA